MDEYKTVKDTETSNNTLLLYLPNITKIGAIEQSETEGILPFPGWKSVGRNRPFCPSVCLVVPTPADLHSGIDLASTILVQATSNTPSGMRKFSLFSVKI